MARRIDPQAAEQELRDACERAQSGVVDEQWVSLVGEVWEFSSKTFVAALGTILLAKSVDDSVDVGTIKALEDSERPGTFSLRTLGHGILVPLSKELNFSLRTTGREPLNNQPFFRYAHLSEIDRARNPHDLERYREILDVELAPLSVSEAQAALASFVSVGIEKREHIDRLASADGAISAGEAIEGVKGLLTQSGSGPWVVQALGGLFLRSFASDVVTRKLNDPSRNFPGDVQALSDEGAAEVSLEARNKPVSTSDALTFVEGCARSGIAKAVILELTGRPTALLETELAEEAWRRSGVAVLVIDDVAELIAVAASLGNKSASEFYDEFALEFSRCLAEVEAPEETRLAWADFVDGGRADCG